MHERGLSLTITSNDKELVVVGDLMSDNIGESSNDLLLGRKVGALLELKIADSTRQGEVAIDTTKVDEATGSADASFLACNTSVQSHVFPITTYLHSEAYDRMTKALPFL